ncbi:STAS domain-containing protein [Carnimonas bestiolae]|uniref:STAS domain-containing protein n=1 Tax=Carnimonas bestiolae TaxID=3402172 RepID=UPI003F4A8F07
MRIVTIDLNLIHFWDITAVAVLDELIIKFRHQNTKVEILRLEGASTNVVDRSHINFNSDTIDQLVYYYKTSGAPLTASSLN